MKTVRIVPEQPDEGKMPLSRGTKVFMSNTELHGVCSIVATFEADEPVRAVMTMNVASDVINAIPVFKVNHPITGEFKLIKCIEFADGSKFEC